MTKTLVLLESKGSALARSSCEVLTAARSHGGTIIGFFLDAGEAIENAGHYNCSNAVILPSDLSAQFSHTIYAEAIAQFARTNECTTILCPANSKGKELAPRIAVKLKAGYIPDVIALETQDGRTIATRPVYAGKAFVRQSVSSDIQVLSLRPNVFTAKQAEVKQVVTVEIFTPSLSIQHSKVVVQSRSKTEGKLDVLEADIIVSGGRGLKSPENFNLIEDLALVLGGAVGASRAVVDAGWRPHSDQVGQTGKTVSPNLYVACGISGAVQHLAGMSSSKIIVAINKDKDAPIFKVCDYGIVGDVFEVLPTLTKKIGEFLGKSTS